MAIKLKAKKERRPDGFTIYQSRERARGKAWRTTWRWRLCRAGRIVAESGEGYSRRYDAREAARKLRKTAGWFWDTVTVDDWFTRQGSVDR